MPSLGDVVTDRSELSALTTFTAAGEAQRGIELLAQLGIGHAVIDPAPAYGKVGCLAVAAEDAAKAAFVDAIGGAVMCTGWVDFRRPSNAVSDEVPPEFEEEVFGRAAIVLLAPCVADLRRLRLTAHLAGDVAEALPYLNAEMPGAAYVASLPVLTFMDAHRMVSLYRDRVAVAKADDIVDAWDCLERLRRLVNETWARRAEISPSYELRRRPPALEIYKRLPGTNCGACGEASCTAFSWAVWRGDAKPQGCAPVFTGERADLRAALLAICSGLGLGDAGDE
jgi:ArsR family metal-binding transcriptional regulator